MEPFEWPRRAGDGDARYVMKGSGQLFCSPVQSPKRQRHQILEAEELCHSIT